MKNFTFFSSNTINIHEKMKFDKKFLKKTMKIKKNNKVRQNLMDKFFDFDQYINVYTYIYLFQADFYESNIS